MRGLGKMDEPSRKIRIRNEGQTVYNGPSMHSNDDVPLNFSELRTDISTRPLDAPRIRTAAAPDKDRIRATHYRAACVQELQGGPAKLTAFPPVHKPQLSRGSSERKARGDKSGDSSPPTSYRAALLSAGRGDGGDGGYVRTTPNTVGYEHMEHAVTSTSTLERVETLVAVGSSIFVFTGFVGWSYHFILNMFIL